MIQPSLLPSLRPFLRMAAIQNAQFLQMREPAYESLIAKLEKNSWFKKFSRPSFGMPLIRRVPWPRTRIASSYFEPALTAPSGIDPLSGSLEEHKETLDWIRRLGRERFEKYFLYPAQEEPPARLAQICAWPEERIRAIQNFTDTFMLFAESQEIKKPEPSLPASHPVARVEREGSQVYLCWLTPRHARGRYSIQYDELKNQKRSGALSQRDWGEIQELLKLLEKANAKQSALVQTLQALLRYQRPFFLSGSPKKLKPLTRREAARRLGYSPSTLTRLCQGRSLLTPQGEAVSLDRFFESRKIWLQDRMKDLLRKDPKLGDLRLREALKEKYHLEVSRRLVNLYRHQIQDSSAQIP